jgi:DNA/RNA-binding domain of Phe-tRNA-synthetase-like protein
MTDLIVDSSIRKLWRGEAILGVCEMAVAANVLASEADFERDVRALEAELKATGKEMLQDARVQQMRATFRAMPDMDPARYRPSSEALLRRFLESGFFRINPLVDMNNLLSARLRIPLGIYDLERLPPSPWTYRIGREGEAYQTFSGQTKNAAGKLVMADGDGIFGSPVADSGRASITPATTHFAVVAYLPLDFSADEAETAAREIEAEFTHHCRPESLESQMILNPGTSPTEA